MLRDIRLFLSIPVLVTAEYARYLGYAIAGVRRG